MKCPAVIAARPSALLERAHLGLDLAQPPPDRPHDRPSPRPRRTRRPRSAAAPPAAARPAAAASTGTNSPCPAGGCSAKAGAASSTNDGQRDQQTAKAHISPHPRDTARRAPPGARRGSTRSVSSSANSSMNASDAEPERAAHRRRQRRHDARLRMNRPPDVRPTCRRTARSAMPKMPTAAASFSEPGPPYFRTSRYATKIISQQQRRSSAARPTATRRPRPCAPRAAR